MSIVEETIFGEEKDIKLVLGDELIVGNEFDALGDGNITDGIIKFSDEMVTEVDMAGDTCFVVYGDMRNLTFSIKVHKQNTDAINVISGFFFEFGSDTIDLSDANGNNVIHGDLRDISMTIDGGTVSADALVSTVIASNSFDMGSDTITAGDGDNIIYGDLRNLSMELRKLSAEDEATAGIGFAVNFFVMGSDTIAAGDGNNIIYGDMSDLSMNLKGGFAKDEANVATIANGLFFFGVDTITTGNGDNVIYGDLRDISINLDRGSVIDAAFVETTILNAFLISGDTITTGDGHNIIYGDLRDLSVDVKGGFYSNTPDTVDTIGPDFFVTGADTITAGNGNNVIYGDLRTLNNTISSPTTSGDQLYVITISSDYILGNDTIEAGHGNNVVYGDLADSNLTVMGGQQLNGSDASAGAFIYSVTMGTDDITLGNGQNIVYGDVRDSSWLLQSGHSTTDAEGILGTSAATSIGIRFSAGTDTITVGDGGNTIFGDAQNVTLKAMAGINTGTLTGVAAIINFLTMAADVIVSGSGDDTIYGDMHDFLLEAQGGQATVGELLTLASANVVLTSVTMGDEEGAFAIHSGAGNDMVSGDLHALTLSAVGGHASGEGRQADGLIAVTFFSAGNDEVYAGAGEDIVYGDMQLLSMSAQGGIVTDSGFGVAAAKIIDTVITMGSDALHGDDGADELYGDLETAVFSAIDGIDQTGVSDASGTFAGDLVNADGSIITEVTGSTITFGDDVLDGGSGNDFLSGDAVNLSGLADFLEDLNPNILIFNKIIWGDDELTGGSDADKFAFTLVDASVANVMTEANSDGIIDALQGDDIVTDFVILDGDVLRFDDVSDFDSSGFLDADDLDVISVFDSSMDVGGGLANDTVITFDGGGTLTLFDTTVVDFASIAANVEVNG